MKKAIYLLAFLALASSCRNNEFVDRNDENILPAYVTEFEAALNLPPIFPEYSRAGAEIEAVSRCGSLTGGGGGVPVLNAQKV